MIEQAVIVYFKYGQENLEALYALEDQVIEAVESAAVGEFDGNELSVDLSDGTLFFYGPDADALFAVVMPLLESTDFMKGAEVLRRYGDVSDPNAREVRSIVSTS